jgi:ERCC4-type nuclease
VGKSTQKHFKLFNTELNHYLEVMTDEMITLIVDTREQTPLLFENLCTLPGTLYSGDYSIQGLEHLFAVERKSLNDLVGSLTSGRPRFERELHRLRGFQFKRLVVIGSYQDILKGNYRSKAHPRSIAGSLSAFEIRYDIPIVFADETEASHLIERWALYFAREIDKLASWRDS